MSEAVHVKLSHDGGVMRLKVFGEIDLTTVGKLEDTLEAAITAATAEVHIDLEHVGFLSSDGIHALTSAYRSATSKGLRLSITAASRPVGMILGIAGLRDVFHMEPVDADEMALHGLSYPFS